MSKEIQKQQVELKTVDLCKFRPGDVCIDSNHGSYVKITNVEEEDGKVFITYKEVDELNDDGTFTLSERTKRYEIDDFERYERPIVVSRGVDNVGEVERMAVEAMKNPSAFAADVGEDKETVALTTRMDKDHLETMEAASRASMERVQAIQAVIERNARQLKAIVRKYKDQIIQIKKVIGVIELYLGIEEEILQIRDGFPADMNEPICFQQRVLYMDEEVGDPRRGKGSAFGIDFQRIDDFDDWVVKPKNLRVALPHKKGVVAMKVSRQKRMYSEDPIVNSFLNSKNNRTYLLIRNGDKVYRIWTKAIISNKLFPGPTELEDAWIKAEESGWSHDREKVGDVEFSYRKKAILLQGLIDRTEVFHPMPRMIDLFDQSTYDEGLVKTIFDAEISLAPPGRIMYSEWKKKINSQIERGGRVLVAIRSSREQIGSDRRDRFLRYYSNEFNCPKAPGWGVYKVERIETVKRLYFNDAEGLIILYQPGGEVYTEWYRSVRERRNRVSFILRRNDPFVLNYDAISLEDVEWFIDCRYEREKYLDMIPVLWEIRDRRLAELEWEKDFVKLVAGRTGAAEGLVWEVVEWWKTKNIWKRPIMEDDAKALRMIEARVRRRAKKCTL